eukprot:scaffold7559_cov137-Skeletonema_menzelii.AAC.1
MNELKAMQWLNKVDDALDWVLGPPPPAEGDENNSEHKTKRADNDDDVVVRNSPSTVDRTISNSASTPRRSPVIIHEDYTCPSTPMAAAVGEYLVLDESPYPSANYNDNRIENKLPAAKDSYTATVQRNASIDMQQSADKAKEETLIISHHRDGNGQSDEAQLPTKLPPPPPPPSIHHSSASKQQPQQKQPPARPPPPPPQHRSVPSSPRRTQTNPFTASRPTPRGSRAAPGVIRRRIRTPSISPPSSPPPPSFPPSPIVQTIESFGIESDESSDHLISGDHYRISLPILLPSHDHTLNTATTSSEIESTPVHPSSPADAVSLVPPPPLSPPMEETSDKERVQSIDTTKGIDNKVNAETESVEIETEQNKDSSVKLENVEITAETETKEDNWDLRGWFSSSKQEEPDVGVGKTNENNDNEFQVDDDDDDDSFHSHISQNSQLTNDGKVEEESDNGSTFERDYADFAIPFPSSSIIQDDRDLDPSLNCYGIVHVRLLRAQRLPCDAHATIHATLSLPPWKGRIRIPPRAAKRGPTGAGICSRWDKPIDKKEDGVAVEEGESPPSANDADDSCTFHMVHAYNNEDTPVPTVALELSVAKLGGVFEKFLCSISLPCHGLMRSPGSWARNWYPASTIFGVNEVEEGADLDTLPFILLETCFEPKVDDAGEATISEEDTLGSIPRDFEIRPSLRYSNLQHMPDSIYSSVDDESTSLMSGITSRNVASTKPHLLRVRSFWSPAWCAVCSKVITTGWLQGSFECEACHIYCCRDCQLQVDVRIPCGSELAAIAVKKAQKYQISLGQIMTTLAPQDENGKPQDLIGSADTTNLGGVRSEEDSPRDIKGIGILNIRVLKACLFDKTYPPETEPSNIFDLDSSNLRSGDHYVRVSWMGSRDSKRTKTVLQASKPVFDSDNMVFDVPHYGMEYKIEVVDANTDRPVGSCLLSAQGLLQWQRDDLLSSLDRLLLSFFHFRQYSEPRRLRLELRKGVKDGFGLNFYNSAKLTEGSNGANSSTHAGEISGWIDLDLHLQEDRKLFYSLEPRRCPPKEEEEFDIALIQLHIARIGALVEDIQKLASIYMYLVGWENDKLTATALVSLHLLCPLSIYCSLDMQRS